MNILMCQIYSTSDSMKTLEWKGNMPYLFSHTLISWIYHGGNGILCGTLKKFCGKVTNERTNTWVFFEKHYVWFPKILCLISINIMRKKGVLQLALQLNFWIALDTWNSTYLYAMTVIKQVTKVARVAIHRIYNATHYNSITTLSQQFFFNYYATPLWL
jgi:hypothetical protein